MLLSKFGLDYYLYRYIIIIFIISSDGFELLVFLLSFLAVNKYFFKNNNNYECILETGEQWRQ